MKKTILIIIGILIALSLTFMGFWLYQKKQKFYVEDKYYANPIAIETELTDIETLIKQKESFAVFIYQPLCTTSYGLSEILKNYSQETGLSYYTIAYAKIKDSETFNFIKYYPSFVIFKKGKMVDFLDAESDDDTNKFKEKDEFSQWLESYIKIKDDNYTYIPNDEETHISSDEVNYNFTLDDVKRDYNKVNIYLFWREGCPFCAKEKAFFENLSTEYKEKYNLYLYEVSNSENNREALYGFAAAMEKEIKGVPFTVIGNDVFQGFNETIGQEIKEAIESQYQNSYDVYFDTILKEE